MVLNETENGLKLVSSIVQQVNGVIYSFTYIIYKFVIIGCVISNYFFCLSMSQLDTQLICNLKNFDSIGF